MRARRGRGRRRYRGEHPWERRRACSVQPGCGRRRCVRVVDRRRPGVPAATLVAPRYRVTYPARLPFGRLRLQRAQPHGRRSRERRSRRCRSARAFLERRRASSRSGPVERARRRCRAKRHRVERRRDRHRQQRRRHRSPADQRQGAGLGWGLPSVASSGDGSLLRRSRPRLSGCRRIRVQRRRWVAARDRNHLDHDARWRARASIASRRGSGAGLGCGSRRVPAGNCVARDHRQSSRRRERRSRYDDRPGRSQHAILVDTGRPARRHRDR